MSFSNIMIQNIAQPYIYIYIYIYTHIHNTSRVQCLEIFCLGVKFGQIHQLYIYLATKKANYDIPLLISESN